MHHVQGGRVFWIHLYLIEDDANIFSGHFEEAEKCIGRFVIVVLFGAEPGEFVLKRQTLGVDNLKGLFIQKCHSNSVEGPSVSPTFTLFHFQAKNHQTNLFL